MAKHLCQVCRTCTMTVPFQGQIEMNDIICLVEEICHGFILASFLNLCQVSRNRASQMTVCKNVYVKMKKKIISVSKDWIRYSSHTLNLIFLVHGLHSSLLNFKFKFQFEFAKSSSYILLGKIFSPNCYRILYQFLYFASFGGRHAAFIQLL